MKELDTLQLTHVTGMSVFHHQIDLSFLVSTPRERERERERETDRQTDRQTDRHRQTETQTDRQTEKKKKKKIAAQERRQEVLQLLGTFLTVWL